MFSLRRPPADALARLAAAQAGRELTYEQHGATAAAMPPGYRHDSWVTDLGLWTDDRFRRGTAALRGWHVHHAAGLTVFPASVAGPGMTFAFSFGLPPGGYVLAAGRVVYVTEEPGRAGFAYGTLPAHPEQGEEAFHLSRDGGRLLFTITAFSRPRHPAARLGAPVSRAIQRRVIRAYQMGMRAAVG